MVSVWTILFSMLFGIGLSVWGRIRCIRRMEEKDTKSSPLAQAIRDLVAVAGGLYLSLIMLVSFLKLDLPEKISLYEVSLDPLACIAIGLAIIQPLFMKIKKG
ncbi:MAG: hypothetical protein ABFC84_00120 [Veillonellales bacterium]